MITLLLLAAPARGQAFHTYQSIGLNEVYCAFRWQDRRPTVGVGYSRRFGGTPFVSAQLEWHLALGEEMFDLRDHQIIAGAYVPLVARRPSIAVGVHGRLTRRSRGTQQRLRIGLAASVVPTYTYAASLDDGPYGTAGLRATYEAVLAGRSWDRAASAGEGEPVESEGGRWTALPAHRVELGGHFDLHLERTLGIALNGYGVRTWGGELLEGEDEWQPEGDLYLGSAYHLGRW